MRENYISQFNCHKTRWIKFVYKLILKSHKHTASMRSNTISKSHCKWKSMNIHFLQYWRELNSRVPTARISTFFVKVLNFAPKKNRKLFIPDSLTRTPEYCWHESFQVPEDVWKGILLCIILLCHHTHTLTGIFLPT
jgi:hypothetical protein